MEKKEKKKPVREKPVKEKPDRAYARMEEEDDASSFYAGDTQEIMTEFEDEPSILSRHTGQKKREPKRVEQPPKRDTRRPEPPMPKEEDDDIEFLDLNDL